MSVRLGVFASGNGSNAINLHKYFSSHKDIELVKIYCNNPAAGIIKNSFSHDIPLHLFTRNQLKSGKLLKQLQRDAIDVIVLAGFLWLIPENLITAYNQRIINIHPSLLPNYGGKGMYGMHVHEAVISAGEQQSGITIHLVDEKFDHGSHLFQAQIKLADNETPESLAARIHELEYTHFPAVVENYVLSHMNNPNT